MAINNRSNQTACSNQTATGPQTSFSPPMTSHAVHSFQAVVVGSGAVSATVLVEASLNGTDWNTVATLSPSGTTRASAVGTVVGVYTMLRVNVSAISGTGAAVSAYMST